MDESKTEPKSGIRRWWRFAAVVGVFVALVAVEAWHATSQARRDFQKTWAGLVARGERLEREQFERQAYSADPRGGETFFELVSGISEPPRNLRPGGMVLHHRNSDWRNQIPMGEALATTAYRSLPFDSWGRGKGWNADIWGAIEPYVEAHREFAKRLPKVLTNRFIVPGQEATNDVHVYLAGMAAGKKAIFLLKWSVLVDLSRGNNGRAMAQLIDASAVVAKLRDDRRMLTQLIRNACGSILIEALWEALRHEGWSDAELSALQSQWEAMDFSGDAVSAFEWERIRLLERWQELRDNMELFWNDPGMGEGPIRAEAYFREAGTNAFSFPRRAFRAFSDAMAVRSWDGQTSYEDGRWFLEKTQSDLNALRARSASGLALGLTGGFISPKGPSEAPPRRFIFSASFFRGMALFAAQLIRMDARKQMAVTAIALERFRNRDGEYPVNLSELVPAFLESEPRDWMSAEKPLRYERMKDGRYRLWSVGDDGEDDGGTFLSPKSSKHGVGGIHHYFGWDRAVDWVWPVPMQSAEREKVVKALREAWTHRAEP